MTDYESRQNRPIDRGCLPCLNVLGAGRIQHENFNIPGMRTLQTYAAVFVSKGHGLYYSDPESDPVEIPEGSLFFLYPGVPHRYGPSGGSWTQLWIVFSGEIPRILEKDYDFSSSRFLYQNIRQHEVQTTFKEVITLLTRKPDDYQLQMSVLTYKLLLSAAAGALQQRPRDGHRKKAIEMMKSRLQENIKTGLSIPEIVTMDGYSYNYLRAVFKDSEGISPIEYLNRIRVEYVCEQLTYSGQSIKEIAYDAGFDDPQYFSRMFKRVTGLTPGQYRNHILSYEETSMMSTGKL